jgi:tRNA pseudouridine32 synthase/23S rRNA pseudouridine746 synthase
MSTSGLILFARGKEMQGCLSRYFRERQVEKRYIAVVAGQLAEADGEINLPLIVDWPNRPRQMVDFDIGKPSLTRYRVLDRDPDAEISRVELEPVTGRSHQLRVHMNSLGHPILGDDLYGDVEARAERLLLHAAMLAFIHPASGLSLRFESTPPF